MILKFFYQKEFKSPVVYGLLFLFNLNSGIAQPKFAGKEDLLSTPKQYTAFFNELEPEIDGKIDDAVWQNAHWTEYFTDIEGDKKAAPTWDTRVKMSWNESGLFIAAELMEPHIWAYLKNFDDIVFYDNDFEVFIDPDNDTHHYYEIEVNAINTIFDLFMPKPYRNGSRAMIVYNAPGLKSAVSIQGTLNKPDDLDKGWTVEMFIPFAALSMTNKAKIPVDGDFWRINFSRVEWDTEIRDGMYLKKKDANGRNLPEHNWVWSAQGVINMHFPERWGYLHFSKKAEADTAVNVFTIPYSEGQKKHLWHVYYLQKEYQRKNQAYAKDLKDLGINETAFRIKGKDNKLWMEATSRQFMVYISGNEHVYGVNDEGLVQVIK